jgi:hypothetical protein
MRVAPACLLIASTLALSGLSGLARAGDGVPPGTGGAGGSAASGGGGSGGAGGEPAVTVQPSATPDNFGCSAAGPANDGAGAAGLLLLGVAVAYGGARARRRRS